MTTAAIVCNAILFLFMIGLSIWAIADQYPHPEEDGFLAYTVLVLLTPLLSIVALWRAGLQLTRVQTV